MKDRECSDCGETAAAHGDGFHTWCEWTEAEVLKFSNEEGI